MNLFRYLHLVSKNLLANFHLLGMYDFSVFEKKINSISPYLYKSILMNYSDNNEDFRNKYHKELDYLRGCSSIEAIPYATSNPYNHDIQAGIENSLPFVVHLGKKLFFPKKWSLEQCINCYKNYIEKENLLGGNHTDKMPHQYQSDCICVEEDDILLDVGCAEALFALHFIEKIKKAFLFESDDQWKAPLQATFAPYKDKVVFIPKFVSNSNHFGSTTLYSLFKKYENESFFVKMDIEGAESSVLQGNSRFFLSNNKIKIACCTYHKKNDAELISNILSNYNYSWSFSDGYMIFFQDLDFTPPFFRKGVIRATNQNQ